MHSILWLFHKTNPADNKVCLCASDEDAPVVGKKPPQELLAQLMPISVSDLHRK